MEGVKRSRQRDYEKRVFRPRQHVLGGTPLSAIGRLHNGVTRGRVAGFFPSLCLSPRLVGGLHGTYRVGGRVLLLSADGGAGSLGSVEGRLATDDSLARASTGAANAATDLGLRFPVVGHCDVCVVFFWRG